VRTRLPRITRCKPSSASAAPPCSGHLEPPLYLPDERERIKALERENRELRQANESLRKASYFAQAELDHQRHTLRTP
jgi:transposase-like protein